MGLGTVRRGWWIGWTTRRCDGRSVGDLSVDRRQINEGRLGADAPTDLPEADRQTGDDELLDPSIDEVGCFQATGGVMRCEAAFSSFVAFLVTTKTQSAAKRRGAGSCAGKAGRASHAVGRSVGRCVFPSGLVFRGRKEEEKEERRRGFVGRVLFFFWLSLVGVVSSFMRTLLVGLPLIATHCHSLPLIAKTGFDRSDVGRKKEEYDGLAAGAGGSVVLGFGRGPVGEVDASGV
mmetsp:Transcript_32758/g.104410  ORF Transcript_32758/g.104410 Transcript_32758/m.104410 type:complete len:234 (+) Transcript_32758:87-788(+)